MAQRTDGAAFAALSPARRSIGTIVNSASQIEYWCQVYGPRDIAEPPHPGDYAFGQFVRADLPASGAEPGQVLIGIICDTVLENPAFGGMGPRLASDALQRAVFTPDFLTERAMLLRLFALGTADHAGHAFLHGVPALALELGTPVVPIDAAAVQAFHWFADGSAPGGGEPYLHLGYLPLLIAQPTGLLPQVALTILDQLQALFPAQERLLSIVRRNLSWKLAIKTTG